MRFEPRAAPLSSVCGDLPEAQHLSMPRPCRLFAVRSRFIETSVCLCVSLFPCCCYSEEKPQSLTTVRFQMKPDITMTVLSRHLFDTVPHAELGCGKKGTDRAQGSKNAHFVSGGTSFNQCHFPTCHTQLFHNHSHFCNAKAALTKDCGTLSFGCFQVSKIPLRLVHCC